MDFWITMAFSVLFEVLKDSKKRPVIRKAVLKLYKAITNAFGSDPEFLAFTVAWVNEQDTK